MISPNPVKWMNTLEWALLIVIIKEMGSYSHLDMDTSSSIGGCDVVGVTVTVKNTGERDGDEVVQLFYQANTFPFYEPYMDENSAPSALAPGNTSTPIYKLKPSLILQNIHRQTVNCNSKWIESRPYLYTRR